MFVLPVSCALHRRAFRSLPASFSQVLGERFRGIAVAPVEAPGDATSVPAMDVLESEIAYTVVLDMPGIARDALQATVEGRRVNVSKALAAAPTKAEAPASSADGRALYRERSARAYARTLVLPIEVERSASQARLEDGVLTLTPAERAASGAAQIAVN